jgi:AcrR family transcriptional regulator
MTATPDRAPKWQRRPEARPAEIVDAAIAAFGELGYHRATLADVARRAGVCPGTVAHYFGSKGGLFEAAIAQRFGQFLDAEEAAAADGGDGSAWGRLERVLRHLWDLVWLPGTLELVRVVHMNAAEFPESGRLLRSRISERWRRLLGALLEAGMASGELRRTDSDVAARMIGSALVGIADSVAAFGPYDTDMPDRDVVWAAVTDMVRRYVENDGPAGAARRETRERKSRASGDPA